MIFREGIPTFPAGVVLRGDHLLDTVTGERAPLNDTGRFMLSLVDGRRTVGEIAAGTSRRYGVATERATDDFLQLAARLNEKYLLNVEVGLRRLFMLLPRILWVLIVGLRSGCVNAPWNPQRLEIDGGSRLACSLGIARRLGPRSLFVGLAATLPMWVLTPITPLSLWTVLAVTLATSVGLLVHEAAHVLALLPVPSFLGVRGLSVAVQHRRVPPRRGLLVAVAGPVVSGGLGLLILLASSLLGSSFLAFLGIVLLINMLGVTVVAADGRNALRHLSFALEPNTERSAA